MIYDLTGKYAVLHDYALASVKLDGVEYPTVRHALEAAKFLSEETRATIQNASTPGVADQIGRNLAGDVRQDWGEVCQGIVADLLKQKFAGREIKRLLLSTGDEEIVYTNGDDLFWGSRFGAGENHMGRLLMELRDSLKKAERKAKPESEGE